MLDHLSVKKSSTAYLVIFVIQIYTILSGINKKNVNALHLKVVQRKEKSQLIGQRYFAMML